MAMHNPAQRSAVGALLLAASLLSYTGCHRAGAESNALTPDDVEAIAEDAYVYGYPLVTMEMTRRVLTNVSKPGATHAPVGQFAHMRRYPTASYHDVTAP